MTFKLSLLKLNIILFIANHNVSSFVSLEPPKIIEKPEVLKVTLGDPVSLECRVSGTPEIKVKWTKDGRELLPSRRHKLHFENNLSSFKILSTQLDDGGSYLFEAANSVDSCNCEVTLVVIGQC